jgi:menaquinone-dependent protoporphyrinogen oxidase
MRVLVTWGSKRGGTEGIGRILGESLAQRGFEVDAVPCEEVRGLDTYGAVIIGGALYANCWPASVRRFVARHVAQLRRVPVWLFSSGPLDASADSAAIPATEQVSVLAERIGAQGHVTFGGRLEADAQGFPASAMAKSTHGDWRNPERIRAWAATLAAALPAARPGTPVEHPAASIPRLVVHGAVGWALCAATMATLLQVVGPTAALVLHAIAAPGLFGVVAWHYFRGRGARDPLVTAAVWTAGVAALDLAVVAGLLQRSLAIFASVGATWIPFFLVFLVTWATGGLMATMPWPSPKAAGDRPPRQGFAAR